MEIFALLASLAFCLALTLSMGEKSYDDAYITYRYAENLADGEGFGFNRTESRLGTTTPLLTIVLAVGHRFFPEFSVPMIGQFVSGFSLWVLSVAVFLLLAGDGRRWAGFYAGMLVLTNPWFVSFWGGEATLSLALVTFSFRAYRNGKHALCGVLASLAFLTRGEGFLVFLIVFSHQLVTKRRISWPMTLGAFGVLIPWSVYGIRTFGSVLPSSMSAKIAQMQSGYWTGFPRGVVVAFQSWIGNPYEPGLQIRLGYALIVLLAILGCRALAQNPGGTGFLQAWIALFVIGYSVLGVPYYGWYGAPVMLGLIVFAGLGAQSAFEWLQARDSSRAFLRTSFLVLSILLVFPEARGMVDVVRVVRSPPSHRQNLYSATGRWLAENTEEDETIGYFEIGFMGYHSRRDFVDPAGLVNAGVSEKLADGDPQWAYRYYRPNFIVINPTRWYERLGSMRDEPWFAKAYRKVATFEEKGCLDSPLAVYERVDEAAVPPP